MKYIIIGIIFLITLLSNTIYMLYAPGTGEQANQTENIFTYRTPDNEIWTNKDRMSLERMRNHYINGSDSIIDSLEAENQQVTPLLQLEPDVQNMLIASEVKAPYFLILNSLAILTGFSLICILALKRKHSGTLKHSLVVKPKQIYLK